MGGGGEGAGGKIYGYYILARAIKIKEIWQVGNKDCLNVIKAWAIETIGSMMTLRGMQDPLKRADLLRLYTNKLM